MSRFLIFAFYFEIPLQAAENHDRRKTHMKINCSHCGNQYEVEDRYMGQTLKCPDCGKTIEIFGKSKIGELAEKYGVKNVAKIPFDPSLASCCDRGLIELFEGEYLKDLFESLEK